MKSLPEIIRNNADRNRLKVLDAHVIHVHADPVSEDSSSFQVWLNTELADFDGLIIGMGDTRQGALLDAAQTLTAAVQELLGVIE